MYTWLKFCLNSFKVIQRCSDNSSLIHCCNWCNCFLPLNLDNGPHYHNTAVLLYLAEVDRVFKISLEEYNNFEAGEGKTVLDTHFAHVSHKIIRWVRVGNNLDTGEQLSDLLKVCMCCLCSTFN